MGALKETFQTIPRNEGLLLETMIHDGDIV